MLIRSQIGKAKLFHMKDKKGSIRKELEPSIILQRNKFPMEGSCFSPSGDFISHNRCHDTWQIALIHYKPESAWAFRQFDLHPYGFIGACMCERAPEEGYNLHCQRTELITHRKGKVLVALTLSCRWIIACWSTAARMGRCLIQPHSVTQKPQMLISYVGDLGEVLHIKEGDRVGEKMKNKFKKYNTEWAR